MIGEALLAFVHIVAVLGLVVFATSEAALARAEWLNAAVVRRLLRVDRLCQVAAMAVLLSGIARTLWGMKGTAWYWSQPLLWGKLAIFVVLVLLSFQPTRQLRRWAGTLGAQGALPPAHEIQALRRRVMLATHLLIVVPLLAALLARGVFTV